MALATLSIDLVAQLASLQAGMDKAGRLAEKNAAKIEAAYAKAAAIGQVLGAALGGAFSVAGITAFVKATVDGVDRLNDLSDATGATIENLSALEDIGARTGTSIDTVGDAVLKLNKVLNEAKPGSDIARQLEAIGLSVNELQRIDPAEALRRVAVALAQYADDGNKARLVQELLGKSAAQIAPLLKDLADAGGLVATVTTQQAKEAEKFNQSLFNVDKTLSDVARTIVGPFVSAMNEAIDKFKEGDREGKSFFDKYTAWVRSFYGMEEGQADPLGPLVERMKELNSLLDTNRRYGLAIGQAGELEAERKALQARIDVIRESRLTSNAGGGRGFVNPAPTVPTILGSGKEPREPKTLKETARVMEQIGDPTALAALRAIDQTDVAKIAEINAQLDALFSMRASGLGGDAGIDAAIEKLRNDLEALSPAAKQAAEDKKRLDAILARTPTGVLAEVLKDIELINAAFDAGKLGAEQWAEAIRESAGKLPQEVEKPLAEISEFAKEASRNIQDALGDSVLATMKGNVGEIEDIWKNAIMRMVAQAAAAQLGEALFGKGYGSTTSSLGGFFGWLFGGGNVSGSHANGLAYVPYDGYRAELHKGERVLTASQASAMDSGGMAPTQIIVQGDVSEKNLRFIQTAVKMERMRSDRRRNG